MGPIVKRVLAAVAAKKVWDKYRESRRPRKARGARLGVPVAVLAAGALAYLGFSGRLQRLSDQIRGRSEQAPPAS
jgi:hypothetical protein